MRMSAHSLSFDGEDDYVSISSAQLDETFSGYSPFTVSIWIYGDDIKGSSGYGNILPRGTRQTMEVIQEVLCFER